jgi:uncharacterized protein with von Willebrand factor type A (vWA) domain
MLGSEAAMLLHPVLHKLWRARRAEARLLGYDSEAVLHDWRPDPPAPPRQDLAPPQPEALERGPIILCLDTSGSMRGAPETIAKAVVLEALRTAHARAPRLPADRLRRARRDRRARAGAARAPGRAAGAAGPDGPGLRRRHRRAGPIERAIDRVHQARWASADLLIVSDGEFGCVPATLARLDDARDRWACACRACWWATARPWA